LEELKERELAPEAEPFDRFKELLAEAWKAEVNDANAMAVASVDESGLPNLRMVLMKDYDQRGFVFYTNRQSAKGRELDSSWKAAANFHWKSLRRQVRIRGLVEEVTKEESDAYFASRPRDSRIGAWASLQSQPLESRELFEQRVAEVEKRYEGQDVPRPPHWSGFRVVPERIEFWYGAQFRLHERQCYQRVDGTWTQVMLYP